MVIRGHKGHEMSRIAMSFGAGVMVFLPVLILGVVAGEGEIAPVIDPVTADGDSPIINPESPLLYTKGHGSSKPTVINQATFVRNVTGGGLVTVTASADPDEKLMANLPEGPPVSLSQIPGRAGTYIGRLQFAPGAKFSPVTVSNISDVPSTALVKDPVDVVIISIAAFNREGRTLVVRSRSTDLFQPCPVLQVFDDEDRLLGTIVGEQFFIKDLSRIPPRIIVRSSRGGSALRNISRQ